MRKPRLPDLRTPAEKQLWADIRAHLAEKRKARREAGQPSLPGAQAWDAPREPLRRGFAADPNRERCECNLSTLLTRREFREFQRQHRRLGRSLTASTVLRIMVCAYLEANRRADDPGLPFGIDRQALDWRCWREPRE